MHQVQLHSRFLNIAVYLDDQFGRAARHVIDQNEDPLALGLIQKNGARREKMQWQVTVPVQIEGAYLRGAVRSPPRCRDVRGAAEDVLNTATEYT